PVPVSTQPWPQQQPSFKPRPQPTVQPRPEVPTSRPVTDSKFQPGSSVGAVVPVPTFAQPPLAPVGVPTITAPPGPPSVAVLPPLPAIPTDQAPMAPTGEPGRPALPTMEPEPLPTSVTTDPPRDENKWQPTPEPSTPQPGTWTPARGTQPIPTQPMEQPQPPSGQSGSTTVRPVVARGQMSDSTPDQVTTLV